MIIRKAVPEDLEEICKIAQTVRLNYDAPQKSGFLVYVLSPEEYKHRINLSDNFYVAINDNLVVGFLMSYNSNTLKKMMDHGKLDHEDLLTKTVLKQPENYIFGDQIGVLPNKNLRGVGTSLMQKLFEDMLNVGIDTMYVGVLEKPILNTASESFVKRLGFTLQESVVNSDNHQWGIYRLRLSQR